MKFCAKCGEEIATRDGINTCGTIECIKADKDAAARKRRTANRKAREDAMRSLGLTKVRGAMGGTYWE